MALSRWTADAPTIRAVGVVLFVVAAVLLVSFGGAIVAAPLTLPALFLVVRCHPSRAFRIAGAVIGALTAAELAWGVLYLAAGEVPVAIWLVHAVAGLAVAFASAAHWSLRARTASAR